MSSNNVSQVRKTEEGKSNDSIMEKECPICFELYEPKERNVNLDYQKKCSHSVCESCAQTMYDNLRKRCIRTNLYMTHEVECPLCRASWTNWIVWNYEDKYCEECEETDYYYCHCWREDDTDTEEEEEEDDDDEDNTS